MCLFLAMGLTAYAQEDSDNKKMALGLGLELNMDSSENFAGGGYPFVFEVGVAARIRF